MDSTLNLGSDGSLGSKDGEDQSTVSDLLGQHKKNSELEFNKQSSSSDDGEGSMLFSFVLAYPALMDAVPLVQMEKCGRIQIQKRILLIARSVQYCIVFCLAYLSLCISFIYFNDCLRKVQLPF